jgi:hypothetical protein
MAISAPAVAGTVADAVPTLPRMAISPPATPFDSGLDKVLGLGGAHAL